MNVIAVNPSEVVAWANDPKRVKASAESGNLDEFHKLLFLLTQGRVWLIAKTPAANDEPNTSGQNQP